MLLPISLISKLRIENLNLAICMEVAKTVCENDGFIKLQHHNL